LPLQQEYKKSFNQHNLIPDFSDGTKG